MFGWTGSLQAGFGVSPPDVTNHHLVPGSRYEKTIYLVRGRPETEMTADIDVVAPEIKDWITIDKGLKFPLPKGEQKIPMKIIIDVPPDAGYGNYGGHIKVRALPSEGGGQVTAVLGVRVDLDLRVSGEGYYDFRLKTVSIPDVEIGEPLVVSLMLENLGNVKARPAKVHVDIYNINHNSLLESGDILTTTWVDSFQTGQSAGEMEINLDLGEYWADVTAYKEEEPLGLHRVHFMVIPEEVPEEAVEGRGLFLNKTGQAVLAIIIVLIILIIFIRKERRKIRKPFRKKPKSKKDNRVNSGETKL